MKPNHAAQAGTFESSDLIILIEPLADNSGRKIEMESAVLIQYGDSLLEVVTEILDRYEMTDIHLIIKDKGALEPVVRARLETAIERSIHQQIF